MGGMVNLNNKQYMAKELSLLEFTEQSIEERKIADKLFYSAAKDAGYTREQAEFLKDITEK
jgi:hypothetical protein